MFIWTIKRRLKKIGMRGDPSHNFVNALGEELRMRAGLPVPFGRGWRLAAVSACTVVLVWGGTGIYAYASENVLPEHPLYPVRMTLEEVETQLALTPNLKTKVQLKHLQRRVREQAKLADRKQALSERHAELFEDRLEETFNHLTRLPKSERSANEVQATQLEREYIGILRSVREEVMVEREKARIDNLLKQHSERAVDRENRLRAVNTTSTPFLKSSSSTLPVRERVKRLKQRLLTPLRSP